MSTKLETKERKGKGGESRGVMTSALCQENTDCRPCSHLQLCPHQLQTQRELPARDQYPVQSASGREPSERLDQSRKG